MRGAVRWAAALAVLLVLGGSTAACTNESTYSGAAGAPEVAVLGDSILQMSTGAVHAALDGSFQVRIRAVTGLELQQAVPAATELAGDPPAVVVVGLGTNDVWNGAPVDDIVADLDELIGALPSTCIVMPTLLAHGAHGPNLGGQAYDNARAAAVNTAIRARADRVVEWDAAVVGHEGQDLTEDGIHPTATGQARLASVVSTAVRSCP